MAFLPVNILFSVLFLVGIIWGWEGEAERNLFAVISSIFMFPLWFAPLFSIVDDGSGVVLSSVPNWLPTIMLENILFWNVVLMYFTGAHLMETIGRGDPIGKLMNKARKQP
jgi:hypothetical protein